VFGAGGLGHVAGGLRLPWRGGGLGNRTWNWAPALAVGIGLFLLSLSYISLEFSLSFDRQTIELLHPFSFAFNIYTQGKLRFYGETIAKMHYKCSMAMSVASHSSCMSLLGDSDHQ